MRGEVKANVGGPEGHFLKAIDHIYWAAFSSVIIPVR
jgi:hypothetical protein